MTRKAKLLTKRLRRLASAMVAIRSTDATSNYRLQEIRVAYRLVAKLGIRRDFAGGPYEILEEIEEEIQASVGM